MDSDQFATSVGTGPGMTSLEVAQTWYRSRELGDGVVLIWEPYVHPFARCNIWYVKGEERDLLIDSGTGLRPLMPVLPRSLGRPLVAVATHIHFDHIGALHECSDRRAHSAEAAGYTDMVDSLTLAPLFRELAEPVTALPHDAWHSASYRIAAAPIHTQLREGDRIDLGGRVFTILSLPGHSPGSIGLFDERAGVLFSGDALYDGELIDDFPSSNVEHYRATMERLDSLDFRVGHGGHGPSFDAARKRVLVRDYLAGKRQQGCPRPPT